MIAGTQVKNENPTRKRSAEDREIEEWARKLVSRPTPQIGQTGQTTVVQPDIGQHSGFDIDSAIGRFAWHSIGQEKNIPCLYRNGVKYCCIRMVELSVMGDLLNVLPQEIYDSAKLCSHFVSAANATNVEAKLLSYINSWHCDGFYGNEPFTERDLVATVQEVEELHAYLMFAYSVLSSGGQNKDGNFTRCGFVRVNNESLIPYTLLRNEPDGEKGVPLFYFEGQTDILKVKAKPLSGWDLAYLKVCCKVQGVRKELIAGDTLNIVKLSDLKSYFPKRTVFTEQCWPPSKGKSLLPKQNLNGLVGSVAVHTQIQNMPGQHRNPLQTPNERITTTMSATTPTTVVRGPSEIVNGGNRVVAPANPGVRRDINVNINGVYGKNPILQKIKATGPPSIPGKVIQIEDYHGSQAAGAYEIISMNIEMKGVFVINMKPLRKDEPMVILPHLIHSIVGIMNIGTVVIDYILRDLSLTVFFPNRYQLRTMNVFGFSANNSWELPLVSYKDLMPKLGNLRLLLQRISQQPRNGYIQTPVVNSNGTRMIYQAVQHR